MRYEYYNDYETIFNAGEIGRKMYFILKGEVIIFLFLIKMVGCYFIASRRHSQLALNL